MNNIEDRYNFLLHNLEKKRETHRNLYNIWKKYLTSHYNNLSNLLNQGEKAIELMDKNKDIDEVTINEMLIIFG